MGRSQVKFNQTHPHRQKYKSRNNDGNEVRSKSKNTAVLDDIPDQPMLHPPLKLRKDLVQEQALQAFLQAGDLHHSYFSGATSHADDDIDDRIISLQNDNSLPVLGIEIDMKLLDGALRSLSASQRLNLPSDFTDHCDLSYLDHNDNDNENDSRFNLGVGCVDLSSSSDQKENTEGELIQEKSSHDSEDENLDDWLDSMIS